MFATCTHARTPIIHRSTRIFRRFSLSPGYRIPSPQNSHARITSKSERREHLRQNRLSRTRAAHVGVPIARSASSGHQHLRHYPGQTLLSSLASSHFIASLILAMTVSLAIASSSCLVISPPVSHRQTESTQVTSIFIGPDRYTTSSPRTHAIFPLIGQ